jgi:hypothetical protein
MTIVADPTAGRERLRSEGARAVSLFDRWHSSCLAELQPLYQQLELPMNKLLLGLSVLAFSSFALPAHATSTGTILPMTSARKQEYAIAKDAGYFAKGSGQTFRVQQLTKATTGKPGRAEIQVWAPARRVGGKMKVAAAIVKVVQGVDGQEVSLINRKGGVWHTFSQAANE